MRLPQQCARSSCGRFVFVGDSRYIRPRATTEERLIIILIIYVCNIIIIIAGDPLGEISAFGPIIFSLKTFRVDAIPPLSIRDEGRQ